MFSVQIYHKIAVDVFYCRDDEFSIKIKNDIRK